MFGQGMAEYIKELMAENARLTLENWQLKGALGYPVPGDIPQGDFKCGMCEASDIAEKALRGDELATYCPATDAK